MGEDLRLFVNYRSTDNAQFAETFRTHFMYRYGRENVFMDFFDSIPPFAHFADFIREQMRAVDAGEPDYVLIELQETIQHNKVIAPILIAGAPFPDKDLAPSFLHPVFDFVNIPSARPYLANLF